MPEEIQDQMEQETQNLPEMPPEVLPEGARELVGYNDDDPDEPEDLRSEDILGDEAGDISGDQEKPTGFAFGDEDKEQEQAEQGGQQGQDTLEIVYKGEVHRVTRDQAVKLAQKGYDYDQKVGRHGKIAQLLDLDPEAQQILADRWRQKFGFGGGQPQQQQKAEFKPVAYQEGMSAEEWLQKNLDAYQAAQLKQAPQPHYIPQQPQYDPKVMALTTTLVAHDKDNWAEVMPHMETVANKYLTREQYARIQQGDPRDMIKLYDFTKQVLGVGIRPANQQGQQGQTVAQPANTKTAPKKPAPFRAKSGGGAAPTATDTEARKPWEMSNAEFRKTINKLKGYED